MPSSLSNSVINDKLQAQSFQVQGKPMRADQSCGLYKSSSALAPDCTSQKQSSWHILCMKSSTFLSKNEIQQYPKGYQQHRSRACDLTGKESPSSTSLHLHESGRKKCPNPQPWGFWNKTRYFQLFFFSLQATCNQHVNVMLTSNCIILAV